MAPSSPPSKFLSRYELGSVLGSGGSAVVYLARGPERGGVRPTVAIKVLHSHVRHTGTQDLLQEARLAGSIEHPNVVRVLEVADEPAGAYLVMEYVDGETFSSLLRQPLPDAQQATGVAIRILLEALEGLHAAHELRSETGEWLGLVHRDFTPQNVLVGRDGRVRLSDFGTARAANTVQRTRTGEVRGKVAYMAPEQVRGLALDRRCDIWAAGVMAWEILAGRPLHLDPDEVQVMFKVVTETPPPLRQIRPSIPERLEAVVERALRLEPGERWPTATELHIALQEAWTSAYGALPGPPDIARAVALAREHRPIPPPDFEEETGAPEPSSSEGSSPRPSSARVAILTALAAGLLAGLLGLWFGSSRSANPETAPAPRPAVAEPLAAPPVTPSPTPSVSTPPERPVPPEPPPTAPRRPATQASLRVSGSEPIARLRVDDTWSAVALPARQAQVSVSAAQHERGFSLHAVSAAGRTLDVRVPPRARAVQLDFGADTSELPSRPGLADNPYGAPP